MINTFRFHLNKDDNSDEFSYYVVEYERQLKIEAIILLIVSIVATIYTNFNIIMVIPLLLTLFNLILIFISIKQQKHRINKKSIKCLIEYNINIIFFELKLLLKVMSSKGVPEKEINKWKKYYIQRVLNDKNLSTINAVIEDIKEHFCKITLLEFPNFQEKEINKFIKKESKLWWNEFYPNFKEDLNKNAFTKNKTTSKDIKIGSKNIKLEEHLRTLNLPTTVRDIKTVKLRYYELIRLYHPDSIKNKDKNLEEIQNKIIEINIAYQEIEAILKMMSSYK